MKNKNLGLFIFFSALLIIGVVTVYWAKFSSPATTSESGKPVIYASFYPYVFLTQQVAGDTVTVQSIIPAGVEPHDFEPSPRDIEALSKSKLVIMNGVMDTWIADTVSEQNRVDIAKHIDLLPATHHDHEEEHEEGSHEEADHDHGEHDPHYWLDPVRMIEATAVIRDALIAQYPNNAELYTQNAEALTTELRALDSAYSDGLASCSQNTIVVSHNAFSYLADRYGFDTVAIAGISPHDEPSAKELADIVADITAYDVPMIFSEPLESSKYADTLARETGKKVEVLDPIESIDDENLQKGVTYSTVMRDNLAKLRMAMNCQ